MYRVTKRTQQQRERFAAMGRKSQRVQAENREPRQCWQPPEVRRVITITDYDHGEVSHTMELRKSNRIDCYDCYINGELWKSRIGWSRVTEWLRKALPRLHSIN